MFEYSFDNAVTNVIATTKESSMSDLDLVLPPLDIAYDYTPVHEAQTRNGNVIPNAFWVINPLTDDVIGSGKSVHRTANFKTFWDTFREGLFKAGVDTTGAEVKFSGTSNQSALSAKVIFKNYDFTKQLGEASHMMMTVRDSHDQSVKRSINAMIYRLACLNGMVAPRERLGFSEKHTTNADPETLAKVAADYPIRLESEASIMQAMTRVKIERDQVIDFFRRNVATYKTKTGAKINDKMLEKIIGIFDNYRSVGSNAYQVYNTLTHLSTHIEAVRDGTDVERKRIRIEQDIEGVIHGEEFQRLFMPSPELLTA